MAENALAKMWEDLSAYGQYEVLFNVESLSHCEST